MDMRRLVGRNVKRFRENKGLTQEQLAEVSGFSQQYISSLLALALGVSHIELVRLPKSRPR
jgi:predicted transcriptional regulator